ncbi:hypothetical protein [Streptomyces sp. NPDC002537]
MTESAVRAAPMTGSARGAGRAVAGWPSAMGPGTAYAAYLSVRERATTAPPMATARHREKPYRGTGGSLSR